MIANNLGRRPVAGWKSQDGCFASGSEEPTDLAIGYETRNKRCLCNRINSCRVSSFNIPAAIGCLKAILRMPCERAGRPRGELGKGLPSDFKARRVAQA